MFKIEIVANTPDEMAGKLANLAEIYSEGGRYVKHRTAVDARDAATDAEQPTVAEAEEVKEPKKPSGRKPKQQTVEAIAEPEAKGDDKPLTIDAVREAWKKYVDAAAVKSGKEETRREEFKAMLAVYGVDKLGQLPEGKWAEAIALGEKKLAELNA